MSHTEKNRAYSSSFLPEFWTKIRSVRNTRLAWDFLVSLYTGFGLSLLSLVSFLHGTDLEEKQVFLVCFLLSVMLLLYAAHLLWRYVSGADDEDVGRALGRTLFCLLLTVGPCLFFYWRYAFTAFLLDLLGISLPLLNF